MLVLGLLVLNYVIMALFAPGKEPSVTIPYSTRRARRVPAAGRQGQRRASVKTQGASVDGRVQEGGPLPGRQGGAGEELRHRDPVVRALHGSDLQETLIAKKVEITAEPINDGRGFFTSLLLGFGPVILLVFLFVWLSRRASGGQMGALGAFGRSRARRVEGDQTMVTFNDVAGIDEAKRELTEVVDFLKNPEKYQRLGGRIPRGVLLAGRPGTGKTLLARAVAGEAGAPFFSISASEFVEAIVGIGASRVRDLFKQAKEAAPAIIFIDEMDAIGRARSGGAGPFSGGNDEREQTLNQILTEMDGFEQGDTVIVLAATNRAEILDAALLRPGRFDRRVTVPAPDKDGRRKILEVHTRSLPLADDVDLDHIAAITPGMVGADIANLANEAALLAARRGHEKVDEADFTDSLEKIILGAPRGIVLSEEEKRRTAYHEAGPRDRRHAHAGRRPRAQGLDHPAHDVAGRDDLEPGHRAHELRRGVPDHADQGRARRADRGGDRVRLDLGRRGVRHPAADRDRAPDGRALGDEPGDRPDRGDPVRGPGPAAAGRVRGLRGHAGADRPRGAADRRGGLRRRSRELLTEHRDKLDSLTERLLELETLDMDEAYAAAGVPVPRRARRGS